MITRRQGRRAVTQHAHRRGKRIVQTVATGSLPQLVIVSRSCRVPVKSRGCFDVIVVTRMRRPRRANNCLWKPIADFWTAAEAGDAQLVSKTVASAESGSREVTKDSFFAHAVVRHVESFCLKSRTSSPLGSFNSDRRVPARLQANRALRRLLHRVPCLADGSLRTLRAARLLENRSTRTKRQGQLVNIVPRSCLQSNSFGVESLRRVACFPLGVPLAHTAQK